MDNATQSIRYDPRFYYIRINSLTFSSQPRQNICLLFRLGSKISESIYDIQDINQGQLSKRQAERQVHILKYGAEEFLNIYLKDGNHLVGYCRVLLSPIFQLPHTKHQIRAKLYQNILNSQNTKSEVRQSALLEFDIYFQFNFSGILEIIPISASLQRNVAQVGEMKPRVSFQFEEQRWTSLEAEGGIHPHWSGHFYASRNSEGCVAAIEDNLKSNKLDEGERLVRMIANRLGNDRNEKIDMVDIKTSNSRVVNKSYFDCTQLGMKSAGSYLKIELTSDKFIGSKPQMIGFAKVRVEDAGFLKIPRKKQQAYFEEKSVNLFHIMYKEKLPAGVLKLLVRFVFEEEKILSTKSDKCDLD